MQCLIFKTTAPSKKDTVHCNLVLYIHITCINISLGFLVAQMVKNLATIQETWVQSLSWEDPLQEGMATHSSILAWRIPMDRGAWQATVQGVKKSQILLSD